MLFKEGARDEEALQFFHEADLARHENVQRPDNGARYKHCHAYTDNQADCQDKAVPEK